MKKRHWFITGISSGLGKSLAEKVIATGDFVMGTLRKQEQVTAFNEKYKDKAHAFLLDVTKYNTIDAALQYIKEKQWPIDVLVNNAGLGFVGAIEETSMEETRRVFEINFFGPLQITQQFLPTLRSQGHGHIIQVSSQSGFKATCGFGIYNASKFALEGFSEALAQEIKPLGLKLTIVEPGPFRTNFAGAGIGVAKKTMPIYKDTAGTFSKKLVGAHGNQEGDPDKAADAIIGEANSENPSLRLPLGKLAVLAVEMKLKSVTDDLEKNREIAENAIFKD